jgi:hypothetical protein
MGYRISMGHRYGISMWDMGYGIWDIGIWDIDSVILDIDMGYGVSIWEMTLSILSFWITIWDILSI